MKKIAAIVVLYNPTEKIFDNLYTYLDELEKIYIVDNSDTTIDKKVAEKILAIPNTSYIFNGSNLGIASALNIGARKAINEGFEYLLTMDQDSSAPPEMVNKLYSVISSSESIGIVAAEHYNLGIHSKSKKIETKEILYTMTSGNLINLNAYNKIGGFLDELFIDHVDHEYCLRLNKNGYKVIKTNATFVYHQLGKAEKKKFFGVNLYPTYHSPIRLYYRTRNRLYVDKLYKKDFPNYSKEDRKHILRELIDMILCEKDLLNKFRMIYAGYLDYRKNKFGKFENVG